MQVQCLLQNERSIERHIAVLKVERVGFHSAQAVVRVTEQIGRIRIVLVERQRKRVQHGSVRIGQFTFQHQIGNQHRCILPSYVCRNLLQCFFRPPGSVRSLHVALGLIHG